MSATLQGLRAEQWILDGPASTPRIDSGAATLSFDEDSVHGAAPCNTFAGRCELEGTTISVGPLATTMRMCEEHLMSAETAFLRALEAVDAVEVDDEAHLILSGEGVTLIFDAVDADTELVRTWQVVQVATGDAIVSVIADTRPTITFGADGEVLVATGCNDIVTTWERDGDSLGFGEAVRTLMACEEPEGVMDQESALAAAVHGTKSFELAPGRLTLLDGEGHILLVAQALADQ